MALPINISAVAGETPAVSPLRMSLMKEISERIRRPFLAGMAILLIAGLGSYFALQRYRLTSLQVAYSDQVMVQLNDLLANLDQAEAAERTFLTSGNPSTGVDPALAGAIQQNLARLGRAVDNGELASHDFIELAGQVSARQHFFAQLSTVRLNQGEAAATAMYTAGIPDGLVSVIHDRVRELSAAQDHKLAAHLVSEHLFSRLLGCIVVAGCILAFASIAYAGYFVDGALRLITNHLTEDARGREALATLNLTLEERINERSAAAAECV
jgi:CHASE3 domain sensor protein